MFPLNTCHISIIIKLKDFKSWAICIYLQKGSTLVSELLKSWSTENQVQVLGFSG